MTQDERWLLQEKYAGKKTPEYEADKRRLARGAPAAYVIGWQPFLGLSIHLDSRPLIPRPETEWWTELLIQDATVRRLKDVSDGDGRRDSKFLAKNYACPEGGAPLRLLDLCAGSGAIGCAVLARLPEARVYFGELDPAHEETIRRNIRENGLDAARADIRIGDLFEPFGDMKFDSIAANPPYIPEKRTLPESVTKWEPEAALYAGADGLSLIRRIAAELPERLSRSGIAWIECDSAHAEAASKLFEKSGFRVEIRADQYGAPRVIAVSFPES